MLIQIFDFRWTSIQGRRLSNHTPKTVIGHFNCLKRCNINNFVSFFFISGVADYLTTEISTSKQKKFSLFMFVDTPGLVDGDMSYPFDVNKSIEFLGTAFRLH